MKLLSGIIFFVFLLPAIIFAQQTAFNSLSHNTNAQSAGFGEIGVVSVSNYYPSNSIQNPSLMSQNTKSAGINFTHNYISSEFDVYNFCIDAFYSIDSSNTFGIIYNNINYGSFNNSSIDIPEAELSSSDLYEFYSGVYYAHNFNKHISVGSSIKYAHSNLIEEKGTISFDIGASYVNEFDVNPETKFRLNIGISILNIGPKIIYPTRYYETPDGFIVKFQDTFFQPAYLNFGIAAGYKFIVSEKGRLGFDGAYQLNKLLVSMDSKDKLFESYINSFKDIKRENSEKLKSVHLFGIEASYKIQQKFIIAVRTGYYNADKNRNYESYKTLGGRLGVYGFYIDIAQIYGSNNNFNNHYLLNIGLNMNLHSKFRFVD